MAHRIIDLSVRLEAGIPSDPPGLEPKIQYSDHAVGATQVAAMFPGLTAADLPNGEGWATENLQLTAHNGTHMDAPWHYASTMDHGRRAITIDEVPLDWCFQRGVKLDFREKPDGYVCLPQDIDAELERIGHTLAPLDIVLINTSAGLAYGRDDYLVKGCGIGRAATLHLMEQGIRVAGTDAWSWDAPFKFTAARIAQTGDKALFWEGHKAGRDHAFCHMEKLHALEALPPHGFKVACFPIKIAKGSAGWTRPVAILDG